MFVDKLMALFRSAGVKVGASWLKPVYAVGILVLATSTASAAGEGAVRNGPQPPGAGPVAAVRVEADSAPDSFLVGYRPDVAAMARAESHAAMGTRRLRAFERIPVDVVEVSARGNREALMAAYRARPDVAYVEPNYRVSLHTVPNDPDFGELWGLLNTGQSGGVPGADIGITNVWGTITTGSRDVIVAVIDTGIDYNHPDLAANMWVNPNPTFGDVHGARWTGGNGNVTSGNPMDDHGHGTHVAGTIGAVGNNGVGIVGVTWNVRLMALKFLAQDGRGSLADAIAAIEYSITRGAHISNNSWGGGGYSQALRDVIAAAGEAGQLFVSAAGNSATDNDVSPHYPATYGLPNIISVAASDRTDSMAWFSCFGRNTVHLAAPGVSIFSTYPSGNYRALNGTSMASPHVAGVAALLKSHFPDAGHADLKRWILDGTVPRQSWEGRTITEGRLHAGEAFRLAALPEDLAPVSGFTAVAVEDGEDINLAWTLPDTEDAFQVVISRRADRYPERWDDGEAVYTGTDEAHVDAALPIGQRLYYGAWADYGDGNVSRPVFAQARVSGEPSDYFTERFAEGNNDLAWHSVTFVPNGSRNVYEAFADPATGFHTDPDGGEVLALGVDDYAEVTLADGEEVSVYHTRGGTFFIGSNGYITFGAGDVTYQDSLAGHFRLPRISGLFADFDVTLGGSISWKQTADRVAVTFQQVRQWGLPSTRNDFQMELFFDGRIRLTWLELSVTGGLAGLSAGDGLRAGFLPSDLIGYPALSDFRITPWVNLVADGLAGGPFTPESIEFRLSNAGETPLDWSAEANASWVALSSEGGTLGAGEFLDVTVSLAAGVDTLLPGLHVASVAFENLTQEFTLSRQVELTVRPRPGVIEVEDSLAPVLDLRMPFGAQPAGQPVTEHITVRNPASAAHSLVVNSVQLGRSYFEDFNDGLAQDWDSPRPEFWSVVNGRYRAKADRQIAMNSTYRGQQWLDASVEATLFQEGHASSAILFVRASPDFEKWTMETGTGTAYQLAVSTQGYYCIVKLLDGANYYLRIWTRSPFLFEDGNNNVARLTVRGSEISVHFNGHLITRFVDPYPPATHITEPGYVGLVAYTGTPPDYDTMHEFDDVWIRPPIVGSETVHPLQALYNAHPYVREDGVVEHPPLGWEPDIRDLALPDEVAGPLDIDRDLAAAVTAFSVSELPVLPAILQPGESFSFDVTLESLTPGAYSNVIVMTTSAAEAPVVEVELSGTVMDDLVISPETGFFATGEPGGPFTPESAIYTLTNSGVATLSWDAGVSPDWAALSTTGGVLVAGASTSVTVSVNAQADVLAEGSYGGLLTVSNATSQVVTTRELRLEVAPVPPPVIHRFNLDVDPGWSREGQWEFGVPQGKGGVAASWTYPDPTSGYTGQNVFGVNLEGDYAYTDGQFQYLTAGPFDFTHWQDVRLHFQRWLNSDYPNWVFSTIDVSPDGASWTNIWSADHWIVDSAWQLQRYDIAAIADGRSAVHVRWGYRVWTTGARLASGWNIDDIEFRGHPVDELAVMPDEGLIATGYERGPFAPASRTYSVTNQGATGMSWSVSCEAAWVTLTPDSGTLEAGAGVAVEIAINAQAALLAPGTYATDVIIRNETTGAAYHRTAQVTVAPRVLDHFAWGPIAPEQRAHDPFGVTLTALDSDGEPVGTYSGDVALGAYVTFPSAVTNMQGLLAADESGAGIRTRGNVFTPDVELTVTHVRHAWGSRVSIWADDGTLLASQPVTSEEGVWMETALDTPLVLVGGQTYRLGAFADGTNYLWSTTAPARFAHGSLDGGCWSDAGDAFPAGNNTLRYLVDIVYTAALETPVALQPASAGAFNGGSWYGNVTVGGPATGIVLRANDGAGHIATSTPFDTVSEAADTHVLTVASAHGAPVPAVGVHTQTVGVVRYYSVDAVVEDGATRYVNTGWSLADHEPASGTSNVFSMAITNDAALTWHWKPQHRMDAAAGLNGSVSPTSAWVDAGATGVVTAVAAHAHYAFTHWEGDVSGDAVHANPLHLPMDGPKAVTAQFGAAPGIAIWDGGGTGNLASEKANWVGDVLPADTDTIILNQTSVKPMTWNGGVDTGDGVLPTTVGEWRQTERYTGTVTFHTTYPAYDTVFTNLVVSGDCTVRAGIWTHLANPAGNTPAYRLRVQVGGDFDLGGPARVNVKELGFRRMPNSTTPAYGPGGATATNQGASHGGPGGNNPKPGYGSVTEPVDLGSGGSNVGTAGGGAFYLTVGGQAVLDGWIDTDAGNTANVAHGSGGSIYIRAASLSGNGRLYANSGDWGNSSNASRGRGAGGRIAIILTDPTATFDAFADASLRATTRNLVGVKGAAGTIYLQRGDEPDGGGTLIVDNDGATGRFTGTGSGLDLDQLSGITLRNGARLSIGTGDTVNLDTVGIAAGAELQLLDASGVTVGEPWVVTNHTYYVLSQPAATGLELGGNRTLHLQTPLALDALLVKAGATLLTYNQPVTVGGDATVEAGGLLHADAQGYGTTFGPGFVDTVQRDGGSYGGRGGEYQNPDNNIIGPSYGSILDPRVRGSGGRRTSNAGGGVVLLDVGGTLTVEGGIRSRGQGASESSGSGGSVNIRAAALAGAGTIDARGGQHGSGGGGGGGGRVAVVLTGPDSDFGTFAGLIHARAFAGQPSATYRQGGGGTVYLETAADGAQAGTLLIDFGNVATVDGWCELPPSFAGSGTYPAETYAFADELAAVGTVLTNGAKVLVTGNAAIGDLHLAAGTTLDLNGHVLRVNRPEHPLDGTVLENGGHIEWVNSRIPAWWLDRYGLPVDGSVDDIDDDGDGLTTWEEFVADTDPTDPESVLCLTGLVWTNGLLRIHWQGGVDARQVLERTGSLAPAERDWHPIRTNTPPTPEADRHDDDLPGGMRFYRIVVDAPAE